jgi:D-glycero-D-manno-heptose 1,7-bisphosphate phosphatase
MVTAGRRRGVIVDRDGTLIDVVRHEDTGVISVAFHPSHVRLLPGVVDGLRTLASAGYVICIATNQPGPAKGQFSAEAVERTNQALVEQLRRHGISIAAVEVCLHHPDGGPGGDRSLVCTCDCRKPRPGLLLRALQRTGIDASAAWMIGDSPSDVQAARAAGMRAALLLPLVLARCELCPLRDGPPVQPDCAAPRFDELARAIVERDGST